MDDRGLAAGQQGGLRYVLVHGDVGRVRTQGRRVILSPDGDDHRHGLVAQSFDHGPEDVEVAVVDGAQSDVDERQVGQGVEPGRCLGDTSWAAAGRIGATAGTEAISGFCRAGGQMST